MLSTSYAPLNKHYRIQSFSVLALDNSKTIYPAGSDNRGTAPARLSGLLLRTSDGWTQARPGGERLRQSPAQDMTWHSSCRSPPPKPQVPAGTVLLTSKALTQGTSAATATLDPKVHSHLHPATSHAMRQSPELTDADNDSKTHIQLKHRGSWWEVVKSKFCVMSGGN